jgi:hypothetical protein
MTYQERRHILLASERTPESVSREKNDRSEIWAPEARKLHTQQYDEATEYLDTGLPIKVKYNANNAKQIGTIQYTGRMISRFWNVNKKRNTDPIQTFISL